MVRDVELRKRVERLLNGIVRQEDLIKLYLMLRRQSFGASSVAEIGNCIGHADKVDRGLATDEARDVFRYFRLSMKYWGWGDKKIAFDWGNVPSDFTHFLKQNLRRMTPEKLKELTGLSHKRARILLTAAIAKFSIKPDGNMLLRERTTPEEAQIIDCLSRSVTLRPLYTEASIHCDFLMALEKNRLLLARERKALDYLRKPLALFAIAHFNGLNIVLDDGWNASLFVAIFRSDELKCDVLGMAILGMFPPELDGIAGLSHAFLITDMAPDKWCSPDLLRAIEIHKRSPMRPIEFIEISPDQKLVLL